MLFSGKLRHRVKIQTQQESQSSESGAISVTWVDVATVWASIEPLSAREYVASQAELSRISTRITIRYRSDITPKMRLYHAAKDKYYNIEGVLADKESGEEYITLPCSEGINYLQGEPSSVIPDILVIPSISGTPEGGQALTASTGTWANDPTGYSYQWYLNDVAMEGETANTLTVPDSSGDIITVAVVASNEAGNSEASYSNGVEISE